ncbi:MAG: DsbA family protein [Sulfurimonas sp.]|uniref:DsbA family protein n=1 Tax=Sulfurimonas sp. TaxID=2022749 RepID=UPI00262DCBC6|nr:thioredoxin domain-containing protein [Sulfurimonas sp.]MCW8894877.1 DsbA family protein [Sulfurimonas sp.]MCW8953713.1 DsbA family protein [Sulfurimonas sp.]MCW9067737.1 DsbA family protein [Sulfurimonas sp.]
MNKQKIILLSVVSLLILFAFGTFAYNNNKSDEAALIAKTNEEKFIRDYSTVVGNKDAEVTLVEFLDPSCETCRAFYPIVQEIMANYEGKIKHVIRYAPFHQDSDYVVKLLEATKKQGKYLETLEALFRYQNQWVVHHVPNKQVVWKLMAHLGLDIEQLKKDFNDPKLDELIKQEVSDAKALGVKKTPQFFVNGKMLQEFGQKQLIRLIESEL